MDRIGVLLEEESRNTASNIGITPADPFTAALNKANTRAIRGLIDLALYVHRQDLPDMWTEILFDVVEDQVSIGEDENSLAVAGLAAVYWPQLMVLDPERAAGLRDSVFGPPHPEEIRAAVLESAVAYSRPTKSGLSDLKSHLLAYLRNDVDDAERARGKAVTWLLLGYLWEVEGWHNLDDLIAFFLEVGQLSEAAADYGRILRNTDPLPDAVQNLAIEFWEAALNADADPDQYKGFGRWSETALPDDLWLTLIHRTLHLSNGGLDWLDGLIERLSRLVPRPPMFDGFRTAIAAPSCVLLLDERASAPSSCVLAG
ncbi:hypothetical protein BH23ACT5_BH23ACT5_06790 [soil metagenome]